METSGRDPQQRETDIQRKVNYNSAESAGIIVTQFISTISLVMDHRLVVDQLKSQWDSSQMELKEQREKVADLIRQLNEERFDKQ